MQRYQKLRLLYAAPIATIQPSMALRIQITEIGCVEASVREASTQLVCPNSAA